MGLIDKLVFFSAIGLFGVFAYYFFVPRLGSLIPQPLQQYIPQQPLPAPAPSYTPPPPPPPSSSSSSSQPEQEDIIPTAPPPSSSGGGFTFNVVGDSRPEHTAAGRCVCGDNPTLVLLTGDFMQGEANASQWQKTYSACAGKQIFASRGNHDGSGSDFLGVFKLNKGKWSAMHKQGPIAFIACDTISDNPSKEEPLFQQAQNDPAIKNIVVIMHEPVFTIGASPDSSRSYHTMFTKYSKVKLVIAGHNHYYYRLKPMNNILYVTNGTGGAADSSGSVTPGTEIHAYGCLKCSVTAGGGISCRWVGNDGKVGDTFGITEAGKLTATGGESPKGVTSAFGLAEAFYTSNNKMLDPARNEDNPRLFLRYISKPKRRFNRYIYDYNLLVNSRRNWRV